MKTTKVPMVVTASRIQAVRYKLAFERYIQQQGYEDVRSLVAFSGTVKDPEGMLEYKPSTGSGRTGSDF